MQIFEIKPEHLLILKHLNWQNSSSYSNAPEVDSKRPFGNSAWESDLLDIFKIEVLYDRYGDFSDKTSEKLSQLVKYFQELPTVLEIICQTWLVQTGKYTKHLNNQWRKD